MVGLPVDGKPLLRAYSIASPNWEEHLEFFSIKVPNGPLTSRLQHIREGDPVLVSLKAHGHAGAARPEAGRNLYLLGTGTGPAPFLSIIQDPRPTRRFDVVVLAHGVRQVADLAYGRWIQDELPRHEFPRRGSAAPAALPPDRDPRTVPQPGRITAQLASGELAARVGLPAVDPARDRFMLCGSPSMLADLRTVP